MARVPRDCRQWKLSGYGPVRSLFENGGADSATFVAGLFPTSFGALTALTSLHLENTALGALPDTLETLTTLTLVRNAQIGSSLPPSIRGSALRSLYAPQPRDPPFVTDCIFLSRTVNNEQLTLSAAQSAALCSGQLKDCDLRGSGIRACGACLVG